MALTEIYIRRDCPEESFQFVEETIIPHVRNIVYGDQHPDAAVTARASHATIKDTFMELGVKVDSEDLPARGWLITKSGLCVPAHADTQNWKIKGEVPKKGLSEKQLYRHQSAQCKLLVGAIAAHGSLWSEKIGWDGSLGVEHKVGVLVEKSQSAWYSTHTPLEH